MHPADGSLEHAVRHGVGHIIRVRVHVLVGEVPVHQLPPRFCGAFARTHERQKMREDGLAEVHRCEYGRSLTDSLSLAWSASTRITITTVASDSGCIKPDEKEESAATWVICRLLRKSMVKVKAAKSARS